MKKAIYVPVLLMSVFISANATAEMYKWTDKSGETHYTATPPPPDAKGKDIEEEIRLSTGKLGNTAVQASAEQPKDDMEQAKADGKKSEEQHQDFCQQQAAALKQMTANSLIKWKDAQGERFLTANEKTKKMKELEQNLSSMCKPEMFSKTPERETSQTEMVAGGERSSQDSSGTQTASGSAGNTGNSGNSASAGGDSTEALPDGKVLPSTN